MKYKIITVKTEKQYIIPMIDEERTAINGWDMDTVIEDWFIRNDAINSSHASRDGHSIGNSKKLLDWGFDDTEINTEEKI